MVPHRFTINLNKEGYQKIINVRASDNEIHRLYISISNGTEPLELDDNIVPTIYCFKPNGEKIWNNCKISNNEVICDFGGDVLNCCGDVVCELFLSTLGTNIITPKFVLSVESTLPFPHFNLLEEQPENWLDEADLYYIKNENGDFIPVELNANRNLLSDIEFPYNTTIGNIEYRTTKALDFDFNRKLYISYYGSNSDITLRYEFYYSIKGNLTELIASYTSTKKTLEIIVPNITKRQLIEKGFDGIRLVLSIPTNCLTSEYKATDWVLEYDECSYKNCKTPYFEKGKYYIMTNDFGKSGEQYNALIKAITEAREFYNKAISDIKLVDNCLTIDFVNGEKYVSESLKGNGITSFAKVSTSGNVDTYEFVADNGEKFSFSVTNTDNSVLEEIKEKLENKVNTDIYNQKITEIENIINTLRTEKVGTDDFSKSVSELQSLVAEVKEYAINVNNEKLDISTFDTAVNNINNAITVLENNKVDNGTYVDDMNAVNASIDSIVKNANALLEMIQSNEIALNQKIDTVAIHGADMTTTPTLTTKIQKEGSTLAIYSTKLFSDTPSDTTTFSGNKINELLADKADTLTTNLTQQINTVNGDLDEINDLFLKKVCYLTYADFTEVGYYNINTNVGVYKSGKDVGYLVAPAITLKAGTYYFADVRGYFSIYKDTEGNLSRFTDTDTTFTGAKTFDTDVELYLTIKNTTSNFYLVDGDTAPTGEIAKGIISLDTKIKLDSVVALENEIKEVNPTTIYVEKDGTGDFSTLKEAVKYSFNNPNTTIYVGKGIYDLIEEFGSDYFENLGSGSSNEGLHLGNNVHIIFSSNSKVVCNYEGDNANVHMYFSPFTCSANGNHKGFTLENLDLECSNVRYAIHDEALGQKGRYINKYKNCRVYIDNTANSDWNNRHCIGGGLGGNGYIEIDGCYFESVATTSKPNGVGIVSYHCGRGTEGDNYCSKVTIRNSYFANNDTVRCSYYGNQTTMSIVTVNNCSLGKLPHCNQENINYTTVNMKLIEFNNTVRES